MPLKANELDFLGKAVDLLERPGFLIRLGHVVGEPLDLLQKNLPKGIKSAVERATEYSLRKALTVALKTIPSGLLPPQAQANFAAMDRDAKNKKIWHTAGAALTGTIGGFFGAVALPLELPITTTLMLRSILEVSRSYGADLRDPKTALECLYVFTMGSANPKTNTTDTAYYTARIGLSQMVQGTSRFIATHSTERILHAIEKGTAPTLLKFIAVIASKFEIAVSEKFLAEAVPIVGALGGGFLNTTFLNYYNDVARCHFGIRKLEKEYGEAEIKRVYQSFL
jgi:hypothetical protein